MNKHVQIRGRVQIHSQPAKNPSNVQQWQKQIQKSAPRRKMEAVNGGRRYTSFLHCLDFRLEMEVRFFSFVIGSVWGADE